jgi:hypothetical protein
MKKQVCCIKCGIRVHPTDWEILKYHNMMPICDGCDLKYFNVIKKRANDSYTSKIK